MKSHRDEEQSKEKEFGHLMKQHEAQIRQLNEQHSQQIEELQARLKQMQEDSGKEVEVIQRKLENALDREKLRSKQLEELVTDLRSQLDTLRDKLAANETELIKARKDLTITEKELNARTEALMDLTHQHEALENNFKLQGVKLSKVEMDLEKLTINYKDLTFN